MREVDFSEWCEWVLLRPSICGGMRLKTNTGEVDLRPSVFVQEGRKEGGGEEIRVYPLAGGGGGDQDGRRKRLGEGGEG